MKNILWVSVFLWVFIKDGYTQTLVVDTTLVVEAALIVNTTFITLGTVEIYATILDSLPLAEELVKESIDTSLYIKPVGDYYISRIGEAEGKFKIIESFI